MSSPPLPPDPLSCLRLWVDNGDEQAFAAVVEAYSGLVFHTARQCLGGDAEGAREVAQNVFLTAVRKAPQLARLDGLSAWFHSTAMKESANHRRSGERRRKRQEIHARRGIPGSPSPEASANPGHSPVPELPDRSPRPSHLCGSDTEALRAYLNDALGSLKPAEREILLSRFFENRTFTAIAGARGSSPDAVRMKCRRAMDKLAAWLRRRGLTAENLTIESVLAIHWSQPTPEHLSEAIHSAVKTQSAASAAGAVSTSITVMTFSKSTAAAAATAVLLAALIPLHSQNERIRRLETETALVAATAAPPFQGRQRAALPVPGAPGFFPLIVKADNEPLPEPVTASALLKNWTRGMGTRESLDGMMIPSTIHHNMGALSRLSTGELLAILKNIDTTPAGEDAKTDTRTMLIQILLAPKAPQSALEAALKARLKDRILGRIAEQWAGQDPAAAQAWLQTRSRQGNLAPARFGEDPESELWSGVTRAIAKKDAAAAADWVQASLQSTVAPAMMHGLAPR